MTNILIAQGDIGQNELTGQTKSYRVHLVTKMALAVVPLSFSRALHYPCYRKSK
jgi:hypothetical protein